ncbi:hypothetical protein G9A89_023760 [Geosiphon pyriformis]|nr:hypothetical protein G9A89_023760 [Geosiphon pyriformis]
MGEGKKSKKSKKPMAKSEVNGSTVQLNGKKNSSLIREPESAIPHKQTKPKTQVNKKVNIAKKKEKSPGLIRRIFTWENFFVFYISYVVFACGDGSIKEQTPFNNYVCSNGISQYIIHHDLFQKYIEPKIILLKDNFYEPTLQTLKQSYNDHGQPWVSSAYLQYESNAKPYLDFAQPKVEIVKTYYFDYVHAPALSAWEISKELYNEYVKEHVDSAYQEMIKILNPYWNRFQYQASLAYARVSKYNEKTVKPWYQKNLESFVNKSWNTLVVLYNDYIDPTVYNTIIVIRDTYIHKIVPTFETQIKPPILSGWEFIYYTMFPAELERKAEAQRKAKEEAERKIKEETERKAKVERERLAKLEAERKAKVERERLAKLEAERKAKAERERLAQLEVERKAKAERERLAKLEAERKAEEARKAKEAAELASIETATIALHQAVSKNLKKLKDHVSNNIESFKTNVENIKNTTLDLVMIKPNTIKSSSTEHVLKIEQLTQQMKQDTEKNISDKKETVTIFAKQALDQLKEKAKEARKDAENSLETLKVQIENHKKETESLLTQLVSEAKNDIRESIKKHEKAKKKKFEDYAKEIDDIAAEAITLFANIESEIYKEVLASVLITIKSLTETTKVAERDMLTVQHEAKKIFEQQHIELNAAAAAKEAEEKNSIKDSSTKPHVVASSSDPVLELLKLRRQQTYDPVLVNLKLGYQKRLGKNNTGKSEPPSPDDGSDDEEPEECDVEGECG